MSQNLPSIASSDRCEIIGVDYARSSRGRLVSHALVIRTRAGLCFVSYGKVIVFKPFIGLVELDPRYWDCSVTTSRYRTQFLNEPTKETRRKLDLGIYVLKELNS